MKLKDYCGSVERAASTGGKRAYCRLGRECHWDVREPAGRVKTLSVQVLKANTR